MSEPDESDLKQRVAELEDELARARAGAAEALSLVERQRRVLDGMHVGMLVTDADGTLVDVNRRALELTGREAADVTGRPSAELFVERERGRLAEESRRTLASGEAHAGFTLVRADGTEAQVEVWFRRVDADETPLVSAVFEEVTALSARDLRHYREGPSQAVGMLCEGVAHQFNNLLARVMACAEDADEVAAEPVVTQNLRTIINTCVEGSRITERLLSYACRRPLWRRPVNPVNILEHTLQMLEPELVEAGIDVVRDYAAVPDMMLDNVQIGEVFTQLIRNARDAMSRGGRLGVSCRVDEGYCVVRVSDTGAGIAPDYLDRIFLPFVGTKGALSGSEVPGMGLGLSVCQGVVASHGGDMMVESTVGAGTTFTVRLPLDQGDVSEDATARADNRS